MVTKIVKLANLPSPTVRVKEVEAVGIEALTGGKKFELLEDFTFTNFWGERETWRKGKRVGTKGVFVVMKDE